VIYTDAARGFLTDHLSEEDLERICIAKDVETIEGNAHVSVCQMCKIRVRDTAEFIRVVRDALTIVRDADL
jgi:hypothetical protein